MKEGNGGKAKSRIQTFATSINEARKAGLKVRHRI